MTAGFPFREPSPRFSGGAETDVRHVANEHRVVAVPGDDRRRRCPPSSRTRPIASITYSCGPSTKTPGEVLVLADSTASISWSIDTPFARRRAASATTWYCFSSPPIGVTWDTPGTASRRRRMAVSAIVRRSIASRVSDSTAKNRISPMMDEIGARIGRPA